MTAKVPPIPENCQGFIPYLIVKNGEEAIQFYQKAFGGKQGDTLRMKDGSIGHAEILIGKTRIMLSQENPEWPIKGAQTLGGCPLTLTLYVEDVDAWAKRAIDAGMKVKKKVEDQFYGDRMGTFEDPYGYEWCLGSRVEEVSMEEMERRAKELFG